MYKLTIGRTQAENAATEYTRRNKPQTTLAVLGNGAGVVDVPNEIGWMYVRIVSDDYRLTKAYVQNAVDAEEGLTVLLQRVNEKGATQYAIVGLAPMPMYPDNPWAGTIPNHAPDHERRDFGQGGKDALDVYTRMMFELRARQQNTPNMTVYVDYGKYDFAGTTKFWMGGSSSAITPPASANQRRCDLLYLDSTNALAWVTGTPAVLLFGNPTRPATPVTGALPLAYVYSYYGQTEIVEADIEDARLPFSSQGAGTLAAHDILSATHSDTLAAAVARGALIIGNSTPKWSALAIGAANKILQSNGTDAAWSTYTLTLGGNSSINGTAIVGTPGTLTVATANATADPHTHAITSSSNPGAAAAILASDASGYLQLVRLGIGVAPTSPLHIVNSNAATVGIYFKAAAAQSVDMLQVVDSAGVNKFALRNDGVIRFTTRFLLRNSVDSVDIGEFYNQAAGFDVSLYDITLNASQATGFVSLRVAGNEIMRVINQAVVGQGVCINRSNSGNGALGITPPGSASYQHGLSIIGVAAQAGDMIHVTDYTFATKLLRVTANGSTIITPETAATSTTQNTLTIGHNSSGTPAAGFGAGLLWTLESSTTADQNAALDTVLWTDATHATRTALRRRTLTSNTANVGYYGEWAHNDIQGTAITIIPNATGDVTSNITITYAVKNNTAGTNGGVLNLIVNSSAIIYSDQTAANTLTLTVAADGSVTIARSAGAQTYSVALSMCWI